MLDLKVYSIYAGMLRFKNGVNTPVTFYLIKHSDAYVLFDAGMNLKSRDSIESYWGPQVGAAVEVDMADEDFCVNAMKKLGVDPECVEYVVLSHLHLDHTGGIGYLPNAKYVVQKKEYEYAISEDAKKNPLYVQEDIHQKVDWLLVDTDHYDLYGDGSIILLQTPGHSVGHQSMLVHLEQYRLILPADACHTFAALAGKEEIPDPIDQEACEKSLQKIQNLAKDANTIFLPPHDEMKYRDLNHMYE